MREIAYISIKPSPSRDGAHAADPRNERADPRRTPMREGKVDYIDVYTPMLDASGKPQAGTLPRRRAAPERRRLRALEARHRAARALTPPASSARVGRAPTASGSPCRRRVSMRAIA